MSNVLIVVKMHSRGGGGGNLICGLKMSEKYFTINFNIKLIFFLINILDL